MSNCEYNEIKINPPARTFTAKANGRYLTNGYDEIIVSVAGGGEGGATSAEDVLYDNSSSGLQADNAQGAIDEIQTEVDGIDSAIGSTALPTTAQTITGAIAEHEQDITALNDSLLSETNKRISLSLYNCTGSISGALYASVSKNHNTMSIMGRVRITSFARTGSNPGVLARLPYIPKFSDSGVVIGFRGESPVENVTLNYSEDDPLARITTTESYSNASGSTLTLMIPIAIFMVKG